MTTQSKSKTYIYDCFGATLEFAESLGFEEPTTSITDWNSEIADGLEKEALEFIESKGYKIEWEEE